MFIIEFVRGLYNTTVEEKPASAVFISVVLGLLATLLIVVLSSEIEISDRRVPQVMSLVFSLMGVFVLSLITYRLKKYIESPWKITIQMIVALLNNGLFYIYIIYAQHYLTLPVSVMAWSVARSMHLIVVTFGYTVWFLHLTSSANRIMKALLKLEAHVNG